MRRNVNHVNFLKLGKVDIDVFKITRLEAPSRVPLPSLRLK